MHDLTQRQIDILKALIEEYIETAEAVGSETLEKKHNLSASPATIRNEMVRLTELGYLKKPHTSAGRMPTSIGMKFYVKQLMREKEMSVAEEVAVKESLWDYRENNDRFLRELTRSLAEKTKTLALVSTEDGDVFAAGYANILDMPEFFDIDITKGLLTALDESENIRSIFAQVLDEDEVHILMEEELGPKLQGPYGIVFTQFHTPMNTIGEIGVLGPTRLNYNTIIPIMKCYKNLIAEVAKGW